MSNASSPTPVDDHDPSAAWDDFDVYKYKDQHGAVQGPFALEHMRRWAAAGQLPPRTHVLCLIRSSDSVLGGTVAG